ncbi:MAG: FAD-binding protein [Chloroflexota bacterium]|nr:FAD-binding protein [Chloroflexota bacterium]
MSFRANDETVLNSVAELQAFVKGHERIHVVGRRSKTALHQVDSDVVLADLSNMRGITDYQPQEYTLTVLAGARVSEIQTALRAEGQYLPFDPLFANRASIGGAVACNLSGSRRHRYGGIRDFILGAAVVDGLGRAFRVGGKVVKNAAGFDLSKFLVGSLGKYAIMTELTFKVFPDAPAFQGLRLRYDSLDEALNAVFRCNRSPQELDLLDFAPSDQGWSLLAGLAGFQDTLPQRAKQFVAMMREETALLDAIEVEDDGTLRDPLAGLTGNFLVKVVISPRQIPRFDALVRDMQRRYSAGGNVAWLATEDIGALKKILEAQQLPGIVLRGTVACPLIGKPLENALAARVKRVLDPQDKLV